MAAHSEFDGCLADGDYQSDSKSIKLEENMIHPKQNRISLLWTIEIVIPEHIHIKKSADNTSHSDLISSTDGY
ncbi:hypothetical protein ACTXT7_000384 [Hymenolepis weldensis]